MRWKIVVRATSRMRLPVEITAMARKATANWPAMPRTTSAAPNAAAPTSSTWPRRGRSTRAADRRAPTVPPTPRATFRYPVAASPPWNTSVAMTTIRIPMPPNANHVSRSMSTTPESAETSIDEGIRRPRKTRLSTPASSGAASEAPVGSPGGVAAAPEAGLGAAPGLWLGRVHRIAAISVNDTALSTNASTRSPVARSRPAMAGPTIQARLSRVAQAELAGPNSRSSRTRLGTRAPMAG